MLQTGAQLLPANVRLLDMLHEQWRSFAIEAVAYHNLASLIGDGGKTTKDIAEKAELKEEWVYRVLRFLSAFDIFEERPGRVFVNTELSNCLREEAGDSMRAMAMLMGTERLKQAWAGLPKAMSMRRLFVEAPYREPLYEYFNEHPEEQTIFNRAMGDFSRMADNAIVRAYGGFASVKRLVDVGGGPGTLLATILAKYSQIQGVLFERPAVVQLAAESGEDRFELVSGDFFKEVPLADTFMLKEVLHNWSDEQCVKILSNCVAAATTQGTRVLVCEQMITEKKYGMDTVVRGLDLLMGLYFNGKERTREEFQELFEKSGLYLAQVIPTRSPLFVLECFVV